MFKRFVTFIILSVVALTACDKNDPVPHPQKASRTVFVYMAADNSLGRDNFDSDNITGMIEGTTTASLNGGNLIVYKDSRSADPQLIKITPTGEEVIRDYPEHSNSASPEVLSEVIKEVKEKFPAESYGIILWSHGSNWFPSSMHQTRAFGQDNNSNWMELSDLQEAIPDHGFDFLIFDACYMGGVEVVYAMKEKADYIVAAPSEIMGSGMPYKDIVPYLFTTTPDLKTLCDTFYNYYANSSAPYATISLIATAQLDNLAAVTRSIMADNYAKTKDIDLNDLQRYFRPKYYGMYDFDDYISRIAPDNLYTQFQDALDQAVIYKKNTATFLLGQGGYRITHYSGLSSFILTDEKVVGINDKYKELDWYRAVYR